MILYPAIDLKDGQCVRLLRGERYAVGGTFIGLGLFAALAPSAQRHA